MTFYVMRQGTKRWHQHRFNLIGGSEIGVLAGVRENHGATKFSLFHEKAGTVPPRSRTGNKRTEGGLAFEAPTARWVGGKRSWKLQRGRCAVDDTVGVVVNGVTKGMGASLDFEVIDAGIDTNGVEVGGDVLCGVEGRLIGPGVLQVKNADYAVFREKWTDGEAPTSIVLQLQHEIACAGYEWGAIVLLLGINDYRLYFYEARPIIADYCRRLTTQFWEDVRDGRAPGIEAIEGAEADTYTLSKLFPAGTRTETLDMTGNNEWPGLVSEWTQARDARLAAEKIEKKNKARIEFLMGGATYAKGGGWSVDVTTVAGNPGRVAKAGEIIGAKRSYQKFTPKEAA